MSEYDWYIYLVTKGLPWILSAISVYSTFLLGRKNKNGWKLGIINQFLWLWWILTTHSWGLIPLNICMWVLYFRNHHLWKKEELQAGIDKLRNTILHDEAPTLTVKPAKTIYNDIAPTDDPDKRKIGTYSESLDGVWISPTHVCAYGVVRMRPQEANVALRNRWELIGVENDMVLLQRSDGGYRPFGVKSQ